MDWIKKNSRYFFCGFLVFAILAVYGLRLAQWQIVQGASFLEKASKSSIATVAMDAARGEILDINGLGLAVNKTGYSIVFDKAYMPTKTSNKTIAQLISLLRQRGEAWTDNLPIVINKSGKYEFVAGKEKEIAAMKAKDFLNMNPYAAADLCMNELIKKYEVTGYSPADTRAIVSVRYNMTKSAFGLSAPYTFAPDISKDTVAIISENSPLLPGVTVKVTTQRQYPTGNLLPHILGTIGSISQDEYDTLKSKGIRLTTVWAKAESSRLWKAACAAQPGKKRLKLPTRARLLPKR